MGLTPVPRRGVHAVGLTTGPAMLTSSRPQGEATPARVASVHWCVKSTSLLSQGARFD